MGAGRRWKEAGDILGIFLLVRIVLCPPVRYFEGFLTALDATFADYIAVS